MDDKGKWAEMVRSSKNAIEDFNNFDSDNAIVYADAVISKQLAEIDELKAENGDLHVKYEAMSEVNAGQQAEIDSLRKMLKRGINDSGHYSSTWNFDARELLDR